MRKALVAAVVIAGLAYAGWVIGQAPPPAPPAPPKAPLVDPNAVAATVNGQPILELAVQRGLRRVPPDRQAQMRQQLLNFLVDNSLIEQHLIGQKIAVDAKAIDVKLEEIKAEIKKEGSTFEKVMSDLGLTEKDVREQITAELRWERYVDTQTTDAKLKEVFEANKAVFDGTMVRARHILISDEGNDPKVAADAKAKLAALKKEFDDTAAKEVAKVPATGDPAEQARAKAKAIETVFSDIASKNSMCPSKAQGGELGYFPRAGAMVEPFAAAAFALKPGEVSQIVTTQFGHHLIMVTDKKQGKEIKFEDAKDEVKEYVGDKLRDQLLDKLRPLAKIVVNAAPKM